MPALIEFVFDTTRAVTHLALSGTLERCPDLRLIVPHAGGTIPFLVDRISLLAARFVPGAADACPGWRGNLPQAAVLRACHLNDPARCCLGLAAR